MKWLVQIIQGRQRITLPFASNYDRMLFLDALNRCVEDLDVKLFTVED